MVPRELIVLATLTTLCVATSAAAAVAAAAAAAASIDFDLAAAAGGDYEVLSDTEERSSTADNDDTAGEYFYDKASTHTSSSDDPTAKSSSSLIRGSHRSNQQQQRQVRCYCNQPHCVSQGYMCRGRGCFTELPVATVTRQHQQQHQQQQQQQQQQHQYNHQQQVVVPSRPEHAVYSGCLERSFSERPCPTGKLCCEQDLCNHVDSPAMRSRLNKTLQVLLGEHRPYFGSMQPTGQEVQTSDGWFKTATIAVPICGFVVLLILASLAIRLLQPVPSQGDKLNGLRMPENAPPLLGPPKMPLV